MRCPHCDYQINGSKKLCPRCGASLISPNGAAPYVPKKRMKPGVTALLVIFGIGVLFYLISEVMPGGSEPTRSSGYSTTTALNPAYPAATPYKSQYRSSTSSSSATSSSASLGEQNALKSAKSYLRLSTGFSRDGLIDQLKYEGYNDSEAEYAVKNCGADWKEQAAKSAAAYLRLDIGFSRIELIKQLQYEGFTYEQAVYGVEQNGY